jgi:outer membrane protein insertion porin family
VRIDLTRDTTVQAENPQRGYRAFARVEHAGGWLPGSFNYDALFTIASVYRRAGAAVLAGRAQFGAIVAPSEADVPFSKRYFLGGAESLRGWGRLEVSPLSPTGQPIGGRSVIVFNGEVRLPVKGPVSSVAFIDAGNVWADSWTVQLDDLRSDIGIGARVTSPFGLVRIDLGYQLTPIGGLRVNGDVRDRRWRVHLSLGQTF